MGFDIGDRVVLREDMCLEIRRYSIPLDCLLIPGMVVRHDSRLGFGYLIRFDNGESWWALENMIGLEGISDKQEEYLGEW